MPQEEIGFNEMIRLIIRNLIGIGAIKPNSYGVVVKSLLDNDHTIVEVDHPDGEHAPEWYVRNADGKAEICMRTRMNSLEACAVNPVVLMHYSYDVDIFPFGGGIFFPELELVVATSGGTQDDDILVSRVIGELYRKIANEHMRESIAQVHQLIAAFKSSGLPDSHPSASDRFLPQP